MLDAVLISVLSVVAGYIIYGINVSWSQGGPAREIAEFTGAHITGLNNNAYQVQRALHYAAKQGLSEQTDFIKVKKSSTK